MRLLHDRYFAYDEDRCCDLASGETLPLADAQPGDELSPPMTDVPGLAPLMEVLDHGRDGDPRWIVSAARHGSQAGALARRAAAGGRARGYVPVLVPLYHRFRQALGEELQDRALLLIAPSSSRSTDAVAAL